MSATDDYQWARRQIESWKSYRRQITIVDFSQEGLSLVVRLRMNGLITAAKFSLTEIRGCRAISHPGNLFVKLDACRRAMEAPERPAREFPWLIPANPPWVWDGAK